MKLLIGTPEALGKCRTYLLRLIKIPAHNTQQSGGDKPIDRRVRHCMKYLQETCSTTDTPGETLWSYLSHKYIRHICWNIEHHLISIIIAFLIFNSLSAFKDAGQSLYLARNILYANVNASSISHSGKLNEWTNIGRTDKLLDKREVKITIKSWGMAIL